MALANIVPTAGSDGIPYCTNVPLTTTEAHLGDLIKSPDPIAVEYGQVIEAVVRFTVNGLLTGNLTYVVLQTDMGDGNWIDVAWIVSTLSQGTATFVIAAGGLGIWNTVIQQSRTVGQPPTPQSNGSNAIPLGGRVQFVGKATSTGGSSSVAGTTAQVLASITCKLMTPR